jgi:hypothetical protein
MDPVEVKLLVQAEMSELVGLASWSSSFVYRRRQYVNRSILSMIQSCCSHVLIPSAIWISSIQGHKKITTQSNWTTRVLFSHRHRHLDMVGSVVETIWTRVSSFQLLTWKKVGSRIVGEKARKQQGRVSHVVVSQSVELEIRFVSRMPDAARALIANGPRLLRL